MIGSLNLFNWLTDIRNGNQAAIRDITIQLQSEDHCAVVKTWKLIRGRIIKFVSGPMKAKGTDVAIEGTDPRLRAVRDGIGAPPLRKACFTFYHYLSVSDEKPIYMWRLLFALIGFVIHMVILTAIVSVAYFATH